MKRRARSKEKSGLPRAGVLSLLFHIALIIILGLSARLVITKVVPSVYRVAIMPFSSPGGGNPQGGPGVTPPAQDQPVPPALEKPKTEETKRPAEVVAVAQPEQKKPEIKAEKPAKAEKPTKKEKPPQSEGSLAPKKQQTPAAKKDEQLAKEEESDRSLQEAIAEIHRKVAIEEIQKRVAEREGAGQGSTGAGRGPSQGPIVATAGSAGSGTGTGSGGGTAEQVYGGMVEAKIKQEWALPKNFPKGRSQLETIIVVIIERNGRVQKSWFEKKSGDALYDQMAMRAIKKAEPLPPFLSRMSQNTFVIGIRFRPD
jgi:colicin import membrane protein